ncbi:lachesin [Eurosta solidaginis]|uniref:lachesin n=1 Tax=Eurosta solidaginis TaxID=178769 RepID=UPI0035308435
MSDSGNESKSLCLSESEIGSHNQPNEPESEFLPQLTNFTVPQGRDVSFTCVVNNLGQYRVSTIKSDSKAIFGIHTHMVSLNPRLSVIHNGHNTWKLHISHVQLNDSGSYMYQVNTDPMKSLLELATKSFEPFKSSEATELQVTSIVHTLINLYCMSNDLPYCKKMNRVAPSIKAVNQLLGAPVEREITLECIVEVYPKPLNGWYRNEGNLKLHNSNKYNISEAMINLYTWHINLTIRHLTKADFGAYSCSSVNTLGKGEARIRLQELRLPPKPTTTSTPYVHTTPKPRRKPPTNQQNKALNEVVRAKETHFSSNGALGDAAGGAMGNGSINSLNSGMTNEAEEQSKARRWDRRELIIVSTLV